MNEPDVVLLHGYTGSPRVWDEVREHLRVDHRVHALPYLGHRGGPPMPAGARPSVGLFADALVEDLDRAGLDRPHLVGVAMGGWLALELGARGRAASVLALSPAGFWRGPEDPALLQMRRAFDRALADARRSRHLVGTVFRFAPVRRFALRSIARYGDRLTRDAALELVASALECEVDPADLLEQTAAGAGDFELGCPVAVRLGEFDKIFPPQHYRAEIQRRIRAADVAVLADVGHFPMIDDPAGVAAEVRALVSSAAT